MLIVEINPQKLVRILLMNLLCQQEPIISVVQFVDMRFHSLVEEIQYIYIYKHVYTRNYIKQTKKKNY